MAKKQAKTKDDSKLFAFLAVFLSIAGFIIALLAKRDDKYVMFYEKQSLILFVACVITSILWKIPLLGWIVAPILNVIIVILWLITLLNSISGREKETPIIGGYASKISL